MPKRVKGSDNKDKRHMFNKEKRGFIQPSLMRNGVICMGNVSIYLATIKYCKYV